MIHRLIEKRYMMRSETDVVVIGSGFGGLGTALSLAERGLRVEVFERLKYPGGCASTFTRNGYRFEAGATLSSGFGEGQLFQHWIERYKAPILLEWLSTPLHFRGPNLSLNIPDQREAFIDLLCRLPDAPQAGLRRFFAHQKEVANSLWALFADLDLLPPWSLASVISHLWKFPKYTALLPDIGRTLTHVMKRYGVHRFQPLKLYLDALCQITVQCAADEVESPFALAAMDYYFRGTAHIQGGLGQLAEALCEAIAAHGGGLHMSAGVKRLEPLPAGGWRVYTRHGIMEAPVVVANVLPQAVRALLPQDTPLPKWLDRQQRDL
jgi:phytoene dehydrogenase-like protein